MPISDEAANPAHGGPAGPAPAVSVIVPVHNTRPYLPRSLGSVFAQTLDQRRIEVIAVDDGSTDGSAAWLTGQARHHPNLTVLTQPASGGAGRPRNVGLTLATGDYVFFLDSDDHLGPEALDRLTRMAQTHGSDVVHGRIVGADGRAAPVDLRTTRARVTPFDSPVYWTLAAYKLFRRAFLEQHHLRFVEGRLLAEDLPFGIAALLRADTVSVLADYDCYYLHGRPDDSNASRQDLDWCEYLHYIGTVLATVEAEVPPGPDRDALMVRHFHGEILMPFAAPYLARPRPAAAPWPPPPAPSSSATSPTGCRPPCRPGCGCAPTACAPPSTTHSPPSSAPTPRTPHPSRRTRPADASTPATPASATPATPSPTPATTSPTASRCASG
ncbi:hypothetical protein STRMOE7_15485 [Streptomyces sp. MOE7]|nr:glycosyltransferase [Streptomyces sp. MOE7]ARH91466.1 hypothetical protein STRMOE7_15485 [Streptomyces sp. MOE7]